RCLKWRTNTLSESFSALSRESLFERQRNSLALPPKHPTGILGTRPRMTPRREKEQRSLRRAASATTTAPSAATAAALGAPDHLTVGAAHIAFAAPELVGIEAALPPGLARNVAVLLWRAMQLLVERTHLLSLRCMFAGGRVGQGFGLCYGRRRRF